jgi:hypothetical protein
LYSYWTHGNYTSFGEACDDSTETKQYIYSISKKIKQNFASRINNMQIDLRGNYEKNYNNNNIINNNNNNKNNVKIIDDDEKNNYYNSILVTGYKHKINPVIKQFNVVSAFNTKYCLSLDRNSLTTRPCNVYTDNLLLNFISIKSENSKENMMKKNVKIFNENENISKYFENSNIFYIQDYSYKNFLVEKKKQINLISNNEFFLTTELNKNYYDIKHQNIEKIQKPTFQQILNYNKQFTTITKWKLMEHKLGFFQIISSRSGLALQISKKYEQKFIAGINSTVTNFGVILKEKNKNGDDQQLWKLSLA